MKGLSKVGSTNDEVLQGVGELKAGDDFRLCLRWLLSIQLDYAGNSVDSTFGLSLSLPLRSVAFQVDNFTFGSLHYLFCCVQNHQKFTFGGLGP